MILGFSIFFPHSSSASKKKRTETNLDQFYCNISTPNLTNSNWRQKSKTASTWRWKCASRCKNKRWKFSSQICVCRDSSKNQEATHWTWTILDLCLKHSNSTRSGLKMRVQKARTCHASYNSEILSNLQILELHNPREFCALGWILFPWLMSLDRWARKSHFWLCWAIW